MEYLKQVISRLSEIVKQMSVSQVVMLVAVIIGVVFGVVAVAGWVGSVNYQPLYSNLEQSEAAEITRYLAESEISYQIGAGGTTIEVPEGDLYEARLQLASQGLPNSGIVGYSIFDETNLGMTEFLQHLNFRRALEGELSRTISSLREVQTARVHIVIPEERLFAEQQKEATASVVLKLKHRGGLGKTQANGITHLIASSVEGLKPGNITILDYDGNMILSGAGEDGVSALSANQLDMTRSVERDLETKSQSMLDGVLGPGKSIIRVTAELNFQQYAKTSESYDPNQTAIRSEQKTEQRDMATKKGNENAEDNAENTSEVIVTNYEVSKTIESVSNAVGTIDRISIAVLLDGTYNSIENAEGVEELVYEPRPQEEIDRLMAIVKNAVGFTSDRNDQIEIVNIAFDKSYLTDQQKSLDEQYTREFYYDIGKKVMMVLGAIILLLYVRKKIRKLFDGLKKIIPPMPAAPSGSASYSSGGATDDDSESALPPIEEIKLEKRQHRLIDSMQKVANEEPDEMAKVIKTLMVE
ncbi:MAG: flagellar M-ring protein FliF [candidate division Zixibacteria bacterium]|nr:flagellar M-ring protein FliF [candidate division Zixibacteria bacterium]